MTKSLVDRIESFEKARPPFRTMALSAAYESAKATALPIIRDLQAENKRLREALGVAKNWLSGHTPNKIWDQVDAALRGDGDG